MSYAIRYLRTIAARSLPRNVTGVLYDWDGTLMEFRERQFLASMNRALAMFGYPEIDTLAGSKSIRDTFAKTIKCPKKEVEALEAFRQDFSKHPLSRSNLMPGAEDLIKKIRDYGLLQGIVSNLDQKLLRAEVEMLGLSGYFSVVIGSSHDEHLKPKPDLLLEALRVVDTAPSQSILYLGDTVGDVVSAKAAGCTSVLVGKPKPEVRPDIIVSNLEQIRKILEIEIHKQSRLL